MRVGDEQAGMRADVFLTRQMMAQDIAVSRATLQRWIKEQCVRIGEGKSKAPMQAPDRRCQEGDCFEVTPPQEKPLALNPQKIPLSILFEDEEILVLNKQAGLVVHPAPGHQEGTLANALLQHCGARCRLPGSPTRPGIVHRLDKDTSGVMVAAKTDAAYLHFIKLFASDKSAIKRNYLAFVRGTPKKAEGKISGAIGRHPVHRQKMAVLKNTPRGGEPRGARPAHSLYKVLKIFRSGGASLLSCGLLTGRTHQIRVHLAHIGHPVLGDPLYGGKQAPPPFPRQALHAAELSFPHPKDKRRLSFQATLPPDMQALQKMLEED